MKGHQTAANPSREEGQLLNSAAMASATDKDILTLIRGFASDKHEGERRAINLKKRIDELCSELDRAHEEVENAKRRRERIELEFKGYEVELAIKEASVQSLEARISPYQDQISTVKSELHALKNEEGALRDDFIKQMLELNDKIRRSLDSDVSSAPSVIHGGASSEKDDSKSDEQDPKVASIEEQISSILSQITTEERAHEEERNRNIMLQQEINDERKKLNLMETIMKDMKELQENKQTSELEKEIADMGEELQRKCECPSCHQFNSEGLEGILQVMEGISQNS
ncbi:hypothetical protein V2J09_024175 [Rumex salicifolius]